eukprot:TRINITY_DN5898_c0_g1_i1.p1 TRINITY_DN5898_c0_g1~~TRINITY_DN5898_c0_g1_i1.p1  ORF type:complete len:1374 (+),score=236.36 TRINITY_DN5898_c0_g1_i1:307-4428(+)
MFRAYLTTIDHIYHGSFPSEFSSDGAYTELEDIDYDVNGKYDDVYTEFDDFHDVDGYTELEDVMVGNISLDKYGTRNIDGCDEDVYSEVLDVGIGNNLEYTYSLTREDAGVYSDLLDEKDSTLYEVVYDPIHVDRDLLKLYEPISYSSENSSNEIGTKEYVKVSDKEHTEVEKNANFMFENLEKQKNWNEEYQELLISRCEDRFLQTQYLAQDFVYVATLASKIIISELFIDDKSIKPIKIGGHAGGMKYFYRNIIFKFALDSQNRMMSWMYGGRFSSDESAMKAAKNELKGLIYYSSLRIPHLHFPLMVLIDYKGYRVIAESVLPITKETIIYGSSDGGKTVHAKDKFLNRVMSEVGNDLHLAPHMVGNPARKIYGPGDQEIHKGTDGRYYVIDLARVFPCEAPIDIIGSTRGVFYKLLRPEFVLKCPKPLCSDGFSQWGAMDPDYLSHNQDIYEATLNLYTKVIPDTTYELDMIVQKTSYNNMIQLYKKIDPMLILHSKGINIRHIGRICKYSNNSNLKILLFTEAFSRVVKTMIRKEMREGMQRERYLSEEQMKETIASYLNNMLQTLNNYKKNEFMSTVYKKIRENFPLVAPIYRTFSVRVKSMDIALLFYRLEDGLGIRFSDETWRAILDKNYWFTLIYYDIVEVFPKVKFMNILDEAEGESLLIMARDKPRQEKLRLIQTAALKFETACASLFANFKAQFMWGKCLYYSAKLHSPYNSKYVPNGKRFYDLILEAKSKFEYVLSIKNDNSWKYYIYLGNCLISMALFQGNKEQCVKYFIDASIVYGAALDLEPIILGKIRKKIEKLFQLSKKWDRDDIMEGLLYLCDKVYDNMNGNIDPRYQTPQDIDTKNSEPKSLNFISFHYLWLDILYQKILCLKNAESSLADYNEKITIGMDIRRFEIKFRDKIKVVLTATPFPIDEYQCNELFFKKFPLILTCRKHRTINNIFLGKLGNLEAFSSKYMHNVNSILDEISEYLVNITYLDLRESDVEPCFFKNYKFQQLRYLNISKCNNLSDDTLQEIGEKYTSLTELDISSFPCELRSGFLYLLAENKESLTTMNLKQCIIKDQRILNAMAKYVENIQNLNMERSIMSLDLKLHTFLCGTPLLNLHTINLLYNKHLKEIDIIIICRSCYNLEHLSFASLGITDKGLFQIGNLEVISRLKTLEVHNLRCYNQSYVPLVSNLQNINKLSFSACMGIQDSSLNMLRTNLRLRELNLNQCRSLRGDFDTFHAAAVGIRKIDLSFTEMDAKNMVILLKNLNLQELYLKGCIQLLDRHLLDILPTHVWMRKLSLSLLSISDRVIEELSKCNKNLEYLELESCNNLSSHVFDIFPSFKNLSCLDVTKCNFPKEHIQTLESMVISVNTIIY